MENNSDKFCISCNQAGHTYLECNKVDFISLFAHSLKLPDVFEQFQPKNELVTNILQIRNDNERTE